MKKQYVYAPGILDHCDPNVIRGSAIERGAIVTISRKDRPYMLPPCFTPIVDKSGNVQIVFKKALMPLNSASEEERNDPMEDFNYRGSRYHY